MKRKQTKKTWINEKKITDTFRKLLKIKHFPYICVLILLLGFWFYWTQIRVINIQKKCYTEVFTPTEQNATWSRGKVWTLMYPAYDPARGNRYNYTFWGWGYPETDSEANVYKRCLIWNGMVDAQEIN